MIEKGIGTGNVGVVWKGTGRASETLKATGNGDELEKWATASSCKVPSL